MSFLSPDTSRASTCCCQDWDQTFKALISITRLDDRISGEVGNFIGIKLMGRFGGLGKSAWINWKATLCVICTYIYIHIYVYMQLHISLEANSQGAKELGGKKYALSDEVNSKI